MPRTMKRPRTEDSSEEEYEEEATFSQRVKVQPDTVPMDQEVRKREIMSTFTDRLLSMTFDRTWIET